MWLIDAMNTIRRKSALVSRIVHYWRTSSATWPCIVVESLGPTWVSATETVYFRIPPGFRRKLRSGISMCLDVARGLKAKLQPARVSSEQSIPTVNPSAGVVNRPVVETIEPSWINIVTGAFLDMQGEEYLYGGAERYHVELARIAEDLGYQTVIYQASSAPWERTYQGIAVRGLGHYPNPRELSKQFHRSVDPAALTIYSPFVLVAPKPFPRSVGISHGVFWDASERQSPRLVHHYWMRCVSEAVKHCDHVVSLDTNTINWVRSTMRDQAEKFQYIPNFVDLDEFSPGDESSRLDDKIVVLYPRRLYAPRGFWLVKECVPYFLKRYSHVEFHFVGQADELEQQAITSLAAEYGSRVQWYCLPPEEMHQAYQRSDIVLIPTVHSEGTSLSCLEAMACGNAVVATNVGGLPDLVIDGFNGLLIPPHVDELRDALVSLMEDPGLRKRLTTNALQVSKSFSKNVWENRWRDVLESRLPIKRNSPVRAEDNAITFVHLPADGVTWDRMKTTPQHMFRAFAGAGHRAYFMSWKQTEFEREPWPGLTVHGRHATVGMDNPVLYLYYAYSYDKAQAYRAPIILYDILDHPSIHEDPAYRQKHEELLQKAHVVVTRSRELFQELKDARPDIIVVPNGVWPEDFKCNPGSSPPEDLPLGDKPRIGFVGSLAQWVDYELLRYAAQSCPEYEFILVGPTSEHRTLSELVETCENMHYLGEKDYEAVPLYLSYLDVGIIPFKIDPVTNNASVLKLYEYAAAGKPIVTTAFREIVDCEVALVGLDHGDFVEKLRLAMELRNDPSYLTALQRLAEESSWQARITPILTAIEGLRHTRQKP